MYKVYKILTLLFLQLCFLQIIYSAEYSKFQFIDKNNNILSINSSDFIGEIHKIKTSERTYYIQHLTNNRIIECSRSVTYPDKLHIKCNLLCQTDNTIQLLPAMIAEVIYIEMLKAYQSQMQCNIM